MFAAATLRLTGTCLYANMRCLQALKANILDPTTLTSFLCSLFRTLSSLGMKVVASWLLQWCLKVVHALVALTVLTLLLLMPTSHHVAMLCLQVVSAPVALALVPLSAPHHYAALPWLQVVRAPVALALVKLLRLMPPEAMRAQLPRVLQGVANLLRNRLQRIRWGLVGNHHGSGRPGGCTAGG